MANKTKRTARQDEQFFAALAVDGFISEACAASGYARSSVYEWKKADAAFGARWSDADDLYVEKLEREADRRAVKGTTKPVFYQGEECGGIQEYSDTLLIFRLKAKRPEVYRERVELSNDPNRGPLQVSFIRYNPKAVR